MDQPIRSGVVIRPMGVGEVVDTAISLARQNFRLLVTITAWAVAPAFVVGAILELSSGIPTLGTFVTAIGQWLAGIAVVVACSRIIVPTDQSDQLRPGGLYRRAIGRLWRLALWFLLYLIPAIPLVILFPLGLYLGVRWGLWWIAVIVDGAGPIQAPRTSWNLTRRAWWHTVGVTVISGLLYGIVSGLVGAVFGAIGSLVIIAGSVALGSVFVSLGGAVGSIVVAPFSVATWVVLYYELRARQEGFDLEARARQQWQAAGS